MLKQCKRDDKHFSVSAISCKLQEEAFTLLNALNCYVDENKSVTWHLI